MDPVNGISQLMTLLKRQLAERSERNTRSSLQNPSPTRSALQRSTTKIGADEIQRRIGQRLRNLEPADRLGTRGTQVFIESVLAWEFGDEVLTDPGLGELVASVRETINEDPALQRSLQRLLETLTAYAG